LVVSVAKKSRWESFLKYYQDDTSTELRCYFLLAKIRQGNEQEYLDQVRDIWLV